jgi:hypothetical protein
MKDDPIFKYAGSALFYDFTFDDGEIPETMTCVAMLKNRANGLVAQYNLGVNELRSQFELRVDGSTTTEYAGFAHNLIIKVSDTATGFVDVIYEVKINWK